MDIIQFIEQTLELQLLLPYQKEMLKMLNQKKIYYVPCAHCGINEIRRYKDEFKWNFWNV